jgi:hypothetical protein
MRVLIVHQRGLPVDLPQVDNLLVVKNTTPPDDGIAIFEMGKEPDWSWPEFVITVGEVDIGRHERDMHVEAAGDINAQIRQLLDSILVEYVEEQPEEEV